MESLVRATEDANWVCVPAQTCFMEHDRLGRDGRLLERVDCIRLEEIARQMNQRDARGQLCPITPGHTDDDAPENQQPPHWGYARNFRALWDTKKKKWILQADWYIRKEAYASAKTFPNVSPEYWHQDGILDPISLLRRTPKLDLGQWIYSRQGKVCRYAMESEMAEDKSKPEDKGGHPASGDPAETGVPPAHEGATQDAPQSNEDQGPVGVHPQFHENFSKCMEHHYKTGEHQRYMLMYPHHAEHNSMGGGMGMPGPTSGMLPAQVPGGHHVPPGGEQVSRMQKNQQDIEVSRYERENQELRGRLAILEKSERVSRYERDLTALLGLGYKFDLAEEVKDCEDMTAEQFSKHLGRIKARYGRVAGHAGDGMIQTVGPGFIGAATRQPAEAEEFTDADLEMAEKYMKDHRRAKGKDPSWEECREYALKNRNGSH